MFRRTALTVCLMASCIWCLALASAANSTQSDPGAGVFKPVAPVGSLMHGQGVFFKAIRKELDEPTGEERNHEIQEAAEVLAELANVNRLNKDKADYRIWATELRDTALAMANEAKKKAAADDSKLQAIFATMKSKCQACHDVYQ